MNDMFDRLREVPEPPLRTSADVLATAKRSARRRTAGRAVAGAFAVVALAGAAAITAQRYEPPRGPQQMAAPPPTAYASPAPSRTPSAPTIQSVKKHSTSIAQTLMDAVPAGYDAAPAKLDGDGPQAPETYTLQLAGTKGAYRTVTLVRVGKGQSAGVVAAVIGNDVPAPGPGADPCAALLDTGIEGATIDSCQMITINGASVRLVTGTDPSVGQVMSATRYLDGGYVTISASQGVRAYRVTPAGGGEAGVWEVAVNPLNERSLSTMPFTATELAALATAPGLLP